MAADLKDTPRAGLDRPALRRRAPLELRRLRIARASAAVRPERLRRDAARAVRVRREAHGRELHDRGAQQRLHEGRRARRDPRLGEGLPRGDGGVRADADDGHLVRPPVRGRADGRDQGDRRVRGGQDAEEGAKKGEKAAKKTARRRTPATACRRLSKLAELVDGDLPDRQPAADRGPGARALHSLRHVARRGAGRRSTSSSEPTEPRCRTIGVTCWSASRSSTWPARSWASAASARGPSSSCSRAAIKQDPLFLQVKEATASVLEDHLPKSRYKQPGERVVQGQRMMQAASDIFLGWTKGVQDEPLPLLAPAPRHEGLGRCRVAWSRSA